MKSNSNSNSEINIAIDYNLTIVDTPGFGDTRGIERDKQIMNDIKTRDLKSMQL